MAQINLTEQESNMVQVPMVEERTANDTHQKGVTQVITAVANDKDPATSYLEAIQSQDSIEQMNSWTKTTTEDRLNVIQQQLGYLQPEQVQTELSSLSDNLDPASPIQGNYVETVKSMPQSIGASQEQVAREAVHMQMRETLSNFTPRFEDMSVGDISANIGGLLIPKRSGVAYSKFLTDMGFISEPLDQASAAIDPTEEILKLREMFWGLDDEGQIQMMDLMSEHLPNASDNEFIRAEIVQSVLGGNFNSNASHVFQNLDNFDITMVGHAVVNLGKGLARGGSMLNTIKRMDSDLAAEVIVKANQNPEAAAKVGVTQAATADAVNPLIHGDVGTLLTGVPDDAASGIDKMVSLQEARFSAVTEHMARHGILDQAGMNDAMKAAEIAELRMPGIIEVTVSQADETGFTLKSTEAYFDSLGRLRKRNASKTVDFTTNDLGEMRAPLEEWVDKGILTLDMNARSRGSIRQWFVTDVESLARKQEMTAKAFDGMMRDAFGGLNKSLNWTGFNARKAAANVDHALQTGSKEGKTYRYDELVNGITGRDLTPQEATAYIGVRNVVEKLYRLKNKQIVDNLLANNVKLYDGADGVLPIRNYSTWQAGNTAWRQVGSDSHHILVPDGGLTLKNVEMTKGLVPFKSKAGLTKAMIQEAYDKGYILARNHAQSGLFKKGEVKTQWAFVKAKKVVSPRGQQVIHRIEGYMPKQRTGAYFFVKKNKNIGLSGAEEHKVLSTAAYSDTEEAAQAWITKQDNPEDFSVVFDRQLTNEQRMYDTASTHGGMYSGARKGEELEFVGAGEGEFADSFEAMQHYINHIGRQYPASLYRIGAEERLLSFARDLGVDAKGLSLHNVLGHATNKGIAPSSKEYKMLKGIHDQLSFVNMIPTTEEANMANRWKNVGSFFEKDILMKVPGWDRVPKYFYQKAAKNAQPQDIIRGITFNHLLGMYNPAQLIVQYSGALVSFAMDPINGPLHVAKQFGWTAMDAYASDPLMQKKMISWFKANDLGDFVGEYELWAKSGFRESVVQGNADYTSVFTKNLPYDAGILRKVTANHTLFYKMGELANTRMAFATAVTRYKKTHNVTKIDPNSVEALEEISTWAEKFRLNMSRANQSAMNKGYKAVPLQFQQIISKYFEKVLPQFMGGTDELTSVEKMRVGVIPTIATGAVGIPAGEFVLTKLFEIFGVDEKELTEEQTRAAKHGVIGWMTHSMFDLNVNWSERMTLGGDIMKNTWESFGTSKMAWQWLGPASNIADRYWRNGQYLTEAFDLTSQTTEGITMDDVKAMPAILFEAASDIPSVTRNFKKYMGHIWTDNPSFIVEGKYMWDWETMNTKTALMASAGFQPSEATDIYEVNQEIMDSSVAFSVFGDTDADVILRIANTRLLTGKTINDTGMYARIVNSMIKKYGPAEQLKLMTLMRDKTFKRKFDQSNLLYKFTLEDSQRKQDDLHVLNALLARKRAERE